MQHMNIKDPVEIQVRRSIFIITGVCAGLPALVWSVSDLIHHRKNGHRISIFIILLLLTDFLELLLSPYILIRLLMRSEEISSNKDWTYLFFVSLWLSSRDCGFLLHQLVALEGILSVKCPLYTASVFSSTCLIFYVPMFLCITIGRFLYSLEFSQKHNFLDFPFVVLIVSVITWIISCGACSADHHSHTSRKPDGHILVVFALTLLVFYAYLTLSGLSFYYSHLHNVSFIPVFLTSLRLISDPLLCVLVCRQNLRTQTSQTPEGLV